MHGSSAEPERDTWRPNAGWLALAAFVLFNSLATNLFEIANSILHFEEQALAVPNPLDRAIDDAARMLMYGVGVVILWRMADRRSVFLLGLGLVSLTPFPLFTAPLEPLSRDVIAAAFNFMIVLSYAFPAFAMAFLEESGIRLPAILKWIVRLGMVLASLLWMMNVLAGATTLLDAVPRTWLAFPQRLSTLPYVLTMGTLLYGWIKADSQAGQRMFLLFVAVSMSILGNLLFAYFDKGTNVFPRAVINISSVTRVAGSLLFAYAILKHRVIDLGFAINRTLVYGAVAFTILVAFGLVEYLAKITIPHAWPQAGSVFTAIIAVLLFLSFHHLHHWFEHHIERLFFHKWHVSEGELKRFIGSAGQFTKAEALCREFVAELRRYAQTSEVALYLRRDDGDFCLETGALPSAAECYPEEARAFALMRTEREPIELAHAHSGLPGELAVPMLDQQGLAGFVLFGAKPDGSHFRPDEEENIGWAAHQVGLDLQALRAKMLDGKIVNLRDRLTATEAERDRLLASLATSKA
ncbi:hypothetical protein GRI89_05510 [Altererythrobacter salegens]|uniref:GAF domain-containing protein n=1 Tax=Croceibacterium salegens TaxID=1737568 RepID=A0A6I4SSX6_9SPHN|nr:hypothetical protein [Croceibacterium salegens]MXO58993.1 hypothetical protein [Croceibacterium salegens]